MRDNNKYFLNAMLSTLDERLKDIEIHYSNPIDKNIVMRKILEQISEQYKKSNNEKR